VLNAETICPPAELKLRKPAETVSFEDVQEADIEDIENLENLELYVTKCQQQGIDIALYFYDEGAESHFFFG
jgi:hypothetical protein